jgi:hypothetical protein
MQAGTACLLVSKASRLTYTGWKPMPEVWTLQKVTSGDFGQKPKGPRPVGTTPIVARHEGKASLERTVP